MVITNIVFIFASLFEYCINKNNFNINQMQVCQKRKVDTTLLASQIFLDMKKFLLRIGRFTKSGLVAFAKKTIANLRRDLNDLVAYNVTEEEIDELDNDVDAATSQLLDTPALSKRVESVKAKNAARSLLLGLIKQADIVLTHFYGTSVYPEKYVLSGINRANDVTVAASATEFIASLDTFAASNPNGGITKDMLKTLKQAQQAFADAMSAVHAINSARSAETQSRKEAFDVVYAKVTHLADIAKQHWQLTNDKRYFDYVMPSISQKSTASPPAATTTESTTPATAAPATETKVA